MLYFNHPADPYFAEVLSGALSMELDYFIIPDSRPTEEDFPELTKVIPIKVWPALLRNILDAHEDTTRVYEVKATHLFFIDTLLRGYIESHNERVAEEASEKYADKKDTDTCDFLGEVDLHWTPFVIIEFEYLIDIYFPDTDYLFLGEQMENMPPELKEAMGFDDTIFMIAQGLQAHPDELKLKEVTPDEDWEPAGDEALKDYVYYEPKIS